MKIFGIVQVIVKFKGRRGGTEEGRGGEGAGKERRGRWKGSVGGEHLHLVPECGALRCVPQSGITEKMPLEGGAFSSFCQAQRPLCGLLSSRSLGAMETVM